MVLLTLTLAALPMDTHALEAKLIERHGEAQRERVERGVRQVRALWRREDGDLTAFALANFLSDQAELDLAFQRFEATLEQVDGHFLEMTRALRQPTDLEGPVQRQLDPRLAAWDPAAHLVEDLFANQIAFVALLNFPLTTVEERARAGASWSRRTWAEARLTGRFARRVPSRVQQELAAATAAADLYIAEYNLWMHHVVTPTGERPFPKGKRLISHWNLRDELKARYADPQGLEKQRLLVKVMERIVTQSIPAAVIDNPHVDWEPFSNTVTATPAAALEADAPARTVATDGKPEPDVRYRRWLANFEAQRKVDPFSPTAPTAIARAFETAELPEARVKALFEEVLTSPLVPLVAKEMERRLGRRLEPADLWYNGFLPRGSVPEAELDATTRQRYPTARAFSKDLGRILEGLGFSSERAAYLSQRIEVDAARGAGHAMQAARRGDVPHLRTRVEKEGMDYKGYNIAVHELGHNVEQVFSLYDVDHTLLAGVPNTAFTEAVAFVFQAKDLELLGLSKPDAEQERLKVLHDFWMTWEIAGVALVDIAVWHWLYEHPKATPKELRQATVAIAQERWNRSYAPVLGGRGTPLLGVYSHMVSYPLYLFNYPLGHLIAFQIEEQIEKSGRIGPEIERMTTLGAVSPDLWMTSATGQPVGAGPLLRATARALGVTPSP